MKFNFKIQQYQTDAVDAVVNVFARRQTSAAYRASGLPGRGSRTAAACHISATPVP